jgi:hypothetical protein
VKSQKSRRSRYGRCKAVHNGETPPESERSKEQCKIANSKECTFLDYTIGGKGKLWIAKKSKERIKTRIKTLTNRNRGRKLEAVIKELNPTLRGWLMYFRLAEAKNWCKETEGWLRRKLRCYRLKQCKRR